MLQVLSERYARVRHYKFLKDGKPVFEYHRNSIDYVNRTLSKIPDHIDHNNHDLNLNDSGSNLKNALRGCPIFGEKSEFSPANPPFLEFFLNGR